MNPEDRPEFPVLPEEFRGLVALVTGAAGGGVGQATARRLAAGGATVVLTDVHERRTREVTEELDRQAAGRVVGRVMDVGDRETIRRVVDEITGSIGPIRILVNNAAVNVPGAIWDYDIAQWDRIVAANLTGPWLLSRLIMPIMREAGGGAIVNVSSYAPDIGGGGAESPYAVTKGGLNVLSRSCAHEGGPFGIRCNTVTMGVIRGTKFVEDRMQEMIASGPPWPLKGWIWPEDVAEAIAFLASDRARMITGETVNVAAGAYMRT